ncbi:hypothetical protein EON65_13240 [archaeon]|nr:MAG: hypothetical protein EON65_13240 [archaeon]
MTTLDKDLMSYWQGPMNDVTTALDSKSNDWSLMRDFYINICWCKEIAARNKVCFLAAASYLAGYKGTLRGGSLAREAKRLHVIYHYATDAKANARQNAIKSEGDTRKKAHTESPPNISGFTNDFAPNPTPAIHHADDFLMCRAMILLFPPTYQEVAALLLPR